MSQQPNHANHQDEQSSHEDQDNHHKMMVRDFRQRFFISTVLTIPILVLSPLIQDFFNFDFTFSGYEYVIFILATVIFFYGGKPFLTGFIEEITEQEPGMMTLIAVAITVSYGYSGAVVFGLSGRFFFWELATLIDIMLLGHWFEMRSVMGASRALEELAKLVPTEAHLITDDGTTEDVKVSELQIGDKVLVKPGEKIPSDGIVIEGATSVNEAMLTGESKPVPKQVDDEVIGGSINNEGASVITVKIQKTGEETYISQVIGLVEEAQQSKSRSQGLADRAAKYLTIIALLAGSITFIYWMFLLEQTPLVYAIERAVTVMVITCPHALGLAIPLVIAVSTAISAKNGLLIRNRTSFEIAHRLDAIIFDKTGTLTKGEFGVSDIVPEQDSDYSADQLLTLAASLERNSEHSIALGIVKEAEKQSLDLKKSTDFRNLPGKGIQGKVDNKEIKVVSPGYLQEQSIEITNKEIRKLPEQGKTTVHILIDNIYGGAIALADTIREESKEAIKRLQSENITIYMLTGDQDRVASWIAQELGIDEYYAEVLPDEKADIVKRVMEQHTLVAMIGDGVNDAPALVTSDIGIAIGAGTDVAVESADIILVKDNPNDVPTMIKLSEKTYSKMVQNLFWATGYNAFAIPLAAGIFAGFGVILNPAVGALLMSLSTVIVAINARLLSLD